MVHVFKSQCRIEKKILNGSSPYNQHDFMTFLGLAILSGSESRVKKAVGRVIQGWMSFSKLLRDSVEMLSSDSKGQKDKGREAMVEDTRGELKRLEKVEQFQVT